MVAVLPISGRLADGEAINTGIPVDYLEAQRGLPQISKELLGGH